MGDVEHLTGAEAVKKIRDIAQNEIALFGTKTEQFPLTVRPMATQAVEDDGSLWFFSAKDSQKNGEIAGNASVQLLYALPGKSEYLSLEGEARISHDRARIDRLWTSFAKAWFSEGKDDPNLTLIQVRPTNGHYWDSKHGKMVQLAKIAVGAVLGKPFDDGVQGNLKV